MEEELRQKAISRYCKGEKPNSIYTERRRSRVWFFKWLKRYQGGDPEWFKDKPNAPIDRLTELNEIGKERIINVRRSLESQIHAQIGASAVKWELAKSGHRFPSDNTIHRVLKPEGLIEKLLISPRG